MYRSFTRFYFVFYTGTIEQKNVAGKTHAYIMRVLTNFRYIADDPWEYHYFICVKPYSGKYHWLQLLETLGV